MEVRKFGADGCGKRDVGQRVTDGRIVLVDEDDHGIAGLFDEVRDCLREVGTGEIRVIPRTSGLRQNLLDAPSEVNVEGLQRCGLDTAKGEMQNGVRLPVVVHLVNGETLEEVTAALKDVFQRGEHERFAEAPGTRDEEEAIAIPRDKGIEQRSLVHVTIILLPHNAEVVGPLRNFLFFHGSAPCLQYSIRGANVPPHAGLPMCLENHKALRI